MISIDRDSVREGKQGGRDAVGAREWLTGTGEVRQMRVAIIHDPRASIRVNGDGNGVVDPAGR